MNNDYSKNMDYENVKRMFEEATGKAFTRNHADLGSTELPHYQQVIYFLMGVVIAFLLLVR